MKHLALAFLLVVAACATPGQFEPTDPAGSGRIFVMHSPILPDEGEDLTYYAVAEPPTGYDVAEIKITVAGNEETCPDSSTCELMETLPNRYGAGIYAARATFEPSGGGPEISLSTPASYLFTYGRPATDSDGPVPVRLPVSSLEDQEDRRIDVLFIRDTSTFDPPTGPIGDYDDTAFLFGVETAINGAVLSEPSLADHDDQLAFYVSRAPGRTADYYSGVSARCGQDPFYGAPPDAIERRLRADFAADQEEDAEITVVLHDRSSYRGCAELGRQFGSGTGPIRMHAKANAREEFLHEFGHAAFGLGDAYTEDTSTRNTGPGNLAQLPLAECQRCPPPTDVPGTTGGTGPTVGPGGPATGGPGTGPGTGGPGSGFGIGCVEDQSAYLPLACSRADPVCPTNAAQCVGAPTSRNNVFTSLSDCEATLTAIGPISPTSAMCRQLCGPTGPQLCGCAESQSYWIADYRTPPSSSAPFNDDIMGRFDTEMPDEQFGATCSACIETTFCMLWETGRGLSDAEARTNCGL
ncbi:MAG: hypothetical protein AAFY84_16925 [Pseudomonadota bacterium]